MLETSIPELLDEYLLPIALGTLTLYFLVSVVRFLIHVYRIRKSIKGVLDRMARREPSSVLGSSRLLHGRWTEYRRTFVAQKGEWQKTESEAIEFFGADKLVGSVANLRYWHAVPHLLVGMGILWTFIGLVVGIEAFDTQTVDGVQDSIDELLSGIGIAFYSSIMGLGYSIVFNFGEKNAFDYIDRWVRELSSRLDEEYYLTEVDRIEFQQAKQREIYADFFSYTEEGKEVLPSHVLRDLRHEAREQTGTLKSFSTDLADGIKISAATVEAIGGKMGDVFSAVMKQQLTPTMEDVQKAVEALRNEKAATNEELVQNVVDNLSETLESMGDQFQQALSGGAIDQLSKVAETVGDTGAFLGTFQSEFTEIVGTLKAELQTLAKKTGEEAQLATMSMREESEAAAKAISSESDRAVQAIREEMEKAGSSLAEEVGTLQQVSAQLLSQQQTNLEENMVVLNRTAQVADGISNVVESMSETLRTITQASKMLGDAAKAAQQSGTALNASTTSLKEQQQSWLAAEKETLSKLSNALDEAKRTSEEYAEQFEIIKNGLNEIFGEIQRGLSEYQETTSGSLNKYLGEFSTQLSTAANALNGTVEALDESFEDLYQVISKVNGEVTGSS